MTEKCDDREGREAAGGLFEGSREEAYRIAREYAMDPACPNFQCTAATSGCVFPSVIREDELCSCRFCGAILPKLKEIAAGGKRRRDIIHMYASANANSNSASIFGPLSIVMMFHDDAKVLSLYRPTVNTPTFIKDAPGRYLSTLRRVQKDSSSPECFDLARRWLQNCRANHKSCQLTYPPHLPKRVLKISGGEGHPTVRLVTDSSRLQGPYAALSHCWGKAEFLRLTTANLTSLERDVAWESLPKTFQHAIKVSLELGISILWIDSLCILQDSREDWEDQSACMADVYRNATVVIAANSGSGAHEGFLGAREGLVDERIALPGPKSPEVYARTMIHHYTENNTPYAIDETLSERSWTYQERLLARRYLSFNQKELHWECESAWHCECGQSEWMDSSDHEFSLRQLCGAETSKEEAYRIWRDVIVPRYSNRKLTVASDKLPALSAVAQAFQDKLQDTYLAGMWKKDLIESFCWRRSSSGHEAGVSTCDVAPSWAWSSFQGPSEYHGPANPRTFTPHSQCLGVECVPSGKHALGEVKGGLVTLRGPLVKAFVGLSACGFNPGNLMGLWTSDGRGESPEKFQRICDFDCDTPVGMHNQDRQDDDGTAKMGPVKTTWETVQPMWEASRHDPGEVWDKENALKTFAPVWCLHLGAKKHEYERGEYTYWSHALVLSTAPGNPRCFTRLGHSREKGNDHSGLFANAKTTDVTIV